jgi:hypothetical protein
MIIIALEAVALLSMFSIFVGYFTMDLKHLQHDLVFNFAMALHILAAFLCCPFKVLKHNKTPLSSSNHDAVLAFYCMGSYAFVASFSLLYLVLGTVETVFGPFTVSWNFDVLICWYLRLIIFLLVFHHCFCKIKSKEWI